MKKVLLIILAVIIVLLPTIVGTIIYFTPDSINPININGNLVDENGIRYEFSKSENSELTSFFNFIYENSSLTSIPLDNITYDKTFVAEINKRDGNDRLTLYISLTRKCYFTNNRDELYSINIDYSNTFLNSKYAISLYEDIHTPKLKTFSNQTILPSSTDFTYTIKNGSTLTQNNIATTDQVLTYYSSNTSFFEFSTTPSYGSIKVYLDGDDQPIYDDSLYKFDPSIIPRSSSVTFKIDATWLKKGSSTTSSTDCFGTASYVFTVDFAPAPVFTLDKTSIDAGEFVIIKADNIIDPSAITCQSTAQLDEDPGFFKVGDSYYALVPFDKGLKSDTYTLTVKCGETTQKFNVDIKQRTVIPQNSEVTPATPITDASLEKTYSLISNIASNSTNEILVTEKFINYEDSFSIRLGFGHKRIFADGSEFTLDGVDFYSEVGNSIPAINSGIVCASGVDELLGKYIVIDHGLGLKSWYFNISESFFSVGDRVEKGDVIAKTGESAFFEQSGFYLMTTVLGKPVCPYAVYENNFILPN